MVDRASRAAAAGARRRAPRSERFRGSTMVMRAAARPGGWGPTREARSSESRELAVRLRRVRVRPSSRVENARAAAVLDAEGLQNALLRALGGTGPEVRRGDRGGTLGEGVQGHRQGAAGTIANSR